MKRLSKAILITLAVLLAVVVAALLGVNLYVQSPGTQARIQMERLFDQKVFLETWVRVREGWSDDESALRTFGYHD